MRTLCEDINRACGGIPLLQQPEVCCSLVSVGLLTDGLCSCVFVHCTSTEPMTVTFYSHMANNRAAGSSQDVHGWL